MVNSWMCPGDAVNRPVEAEGFQGWWGGALPVTLQYTGAHVSLSAMGGGFGGLGCYLSDRLLLSFFFL